MLKLAMIGTGGYAFELIKRIWQIPQDIQLLAVSSNPARKSPARQICRDKGLKVCDDVDQLLDAVAGICPVIFIPTPIHTHFPLARKCIEAGFDVFLEKPPVATIQKLDQLTRLANEHNKKVAIAFQSLYSPVIGRLKSDLINGTFGPIHNITSLGAWPRDDDYFGRNSWAGQLKLNDQWILDGTVNNPFAHMLADQLYLAGYLPGKMAMPKSVQAELYHAHDIAAEDTSSLRVITENNIELIFNATLCPEKQIDPRTTINCRDAAIEYHDFTHAKITYNTGRVEKIQNPPDIRVHMLKELARCYLHNQPFAADLQTCRPFTLCANGAFESSGRVHNIAKKYRKRYTLNDAAFTAVIDINQHLQTAHVRAKLLSQLKLPWTVRSKAFNLSDNYTHFPSKPLPIE